MSIDILQKSFADAVLDPENLLPTGLIGHEGTDIGKRFSVYQNNVVSSLVTGLKTAFPIVLKIVGDEFFSAMAVVFVRDHPPKSPIMMLYGDMFPDFLSKFEPVADLPYLPEVAYLEQLRRQVYHAADKISAPQHAFANISEADFQSLTLSIHPASAFAVFKYPVASIWRWNNAEPETAKPEIPSNGEEILVWRFENDVRMRLLSVGSVCFMKNLQCNISLGESAERASEIDGFDLSSAIATLIETRLITAINRGY